MSYFTATQIGKALAKARVSAGLSQVEIARRIEKGERTVQSWEKGCTSPDSDEIMDWCTACGASPIAVFMEMIHPELYAAPDDGKTDTELDAMLCRFVVNLPPLTKRLLLFVLKGNHGSSPPAVISEVAANLHCPQQPGQRVRNHHQPIQLCPEHGIRPLPGRPTAANRRFEGKLQGRA